MLQAFLKHIAELRNNSILEIDMTHNLLNPVDTTKDCGVQLDSLDTVFEDYVNNISDSNSHSSGVIFLIAILYII